MYRVNAHNPISLHLSLQVDEIVLLGGDNRATSEITKLVSQLPPAVQAITGVDLSGVLAKVPGASAAQ